MSNYTKITNFAAKDSGALDANRLITGTAHDNEFNAISTAISTKADLISPILVTPNIGVASGTSLTLSGAISGTTGTFSGALSGTTGTFSSTTSATQYTSTIATGTAPLIVASTTEVANLHAATATLATTATNATNFAGGTVAATSVTSTGVISSSSPSAGIGYTTGAGGSVVQIVSQTTAVTLNKICGRITMYGASISAGAVVGFIFNNSTIINTDTINFSENTDFGVMVSATFVSNGSCRVIVFAPAGTSFGSAPIINFSINRAIIT